MIDPLAGAAVVTADVVVAAAAAAATTTSEIEGPDKPDAAAPEASATSIPLFLFSPTSITARPSC